ncbi:type VI secretion system protein [Alkalispirillum mobile]|uniref:Type VI secretion system protein n=1 Tax=Alkalispirillum mobile TaxID=85925 RepID=A0A498C8D3_9GAMM|nr:type VI secretion system baseplate subunit TssE [Alkalispirillum mobile]RLK51713.1 type VI secretion system protein [Alkalispirillum mobile]
MQPWLDPPRGLRLFERLGVPCAPTERPADTEWVVDSIKSHLLELLNSHPGHCASTPGLGLVDFNDASIGALDLRLNIRQAIQDCIECYEPRIRRVSVEVLEPAGEPTRLWFRVHALVDDSRQGRHTTLDLMLNGRRYRFVD